MNYAQKYVLSVTFFIEVVVNYNKREIGFFSDRQYDILTLNVTFSWNAAITLFFSR